MGLAGRDLVEWVDSMNAAEERLIDSVTNQTADVFKKLLPRARAKALHDSKLNSEINITIQLKLGDKPSAKVEGFVPPTVVSCQEF